MTETKLTIGVVALARTTFDMALAEEKTANMRALLQTEERFALVGPRELTTSLDEAKAAAQSLAMEPLDLLLVFQATFADSTMVMALAKAIDAPLVMWAVPEAPNGARLRLNSFCGINLGGHAMKRAGLSFDYIYAPADDPAALEKIMTWAKAGRAKRLLAQARIGRIGQHPEGFDSCELDAAALKSRFGVEIVQMELATVFEGARSVPEADVDEALAALRAQIEIDATLDEAALRKSLATYVTMRRLAAEQGLHAMAVRCWPEFFTELGCAACGAMSMLTNELTPCSCEADINGALSQLLLQWVSDAPVFGTDMVAFDGKENTAVVWHCGKAPLAMADPEFQARATIHSNRKLPLLMEFPLKPGRVTIVRISEAPGTGRYQLVVGSGEMLRAPLSFSGTSGVLRFDSGAEAALDTIMSEGLEHHIELTYGDHVSALLALAELLEMPVLRL
ncbi:MAG: L-fucose/L-arabinose isomerase family protein [Anaerolineales bacterium]